MAKEYVPIYFDWLDVTQDLTPDEKGNLIDAVVSYASGAEYEHLLCGSAKIAFRFLKGQVDRNATLSEVRRQARQGKTQQPAYDPLCDEEQTITNDNKTEQSTSNSPKEKEKEKEKEKDKKKEQDPLKRFTPPTLGEVAAYCKERGKGVDPERWHAYYTANGWKVGKNPMRDWKAAVRTWETNGTGARPVKKVVAQDYGQRDYSGSAESMDDVLNRLQGRRTAV